MEKKSRKSTKKSIGGGNKRLLNQRRNRKYSRKSIRNQKGGDGWRYPVDMNDLINNRWFHSKVKSKPDAESILKSRPEDKLFLVWREDKKEETWLSYLKKKIIITLTGSYDVIHKRIRKKFSIRGDGGVYLEGRRLFKYSEKKPEELLKYLKKKGEINNYIDSSHQIRALDITYEVPLEYTDNTTVNKTVIVDNSGIFLDANRHPTQWDTPENSHGGNNTMIDQDTAELQPQLTVYSKPSTVTTLKDYGIEREQFNLMRSNQSLHLSLANSDFSTA